MNRLVIRHGEYDEKHPDIETAWGPPLTDEALATARVLGGQMRLKGIEIGTAAVSEQLRAQQTALALGANILKVYPALNEVMLTEEEKDMLLRNVVPSHVRERGREILANPPAERTIVSHGGTLAGLFFELGLQVERFLPVHLEVREVDF